MHHVLRKCSGIGVGFCVTGTPGRRATGVVEPDMNGSALLQLVDQRACQRRAIVGVNRQYAVALTVPGCQAIAYRLQLVERTGQQYHLCALLGQLTGAGLAQPLTCTTDQRAPARQIQIHAIAPPRYQSRTSLARGGVQHIRTRRRVPGRCLPSGSARCGS